VPPSPERVVTLFREGPLEEKTLVNTTFSNGYALLVGVGLDLPVTAKDATALRDVLASPSRAAYPPDQIELLTEAHANRQSILNAFDKLIEQVNSNPDATVIIYFSGHGVQVEHPNTPTEYFLLPYGYDSNFWANTAISGLEFTSKIEAIKARKLVVLLDCCHAGGIPAFKAPDEVAIKSVPRPPNLLNILETGSGRVVVASSRENEYSYTGTPYSVFTACLLDALAGKGAKKQDGFARILDVLSYLIEQVPQRASGPQHPCVNRVHNLTDDFPLCYYAGGSKDIPSEVSSFEPGSSQQEYDMNTSHYPSKYTINNDGPAQGLVIGDYTNVQIYYRDQNKPQSSRLSSSNSDDHSQASYHPEHPSKPVSAGLQHLQQKLSELTNQYDLLTKLIEGLRTELVLEIGTRSRLSLEYQIKTEMDKRDEIEKQRQMVEARIKCVHDESSKQ